MVEQRPSKAIEVLRGPYRQLDMEGVIVGVSHQAIHETLAYLDAPEATLSQPSPDVEELVGRLRKFVDAVEGTEWIFGPGTTPLMLEAANALTALPVGWRAMDSAPYGEDGILVCDATKPHPAVGVARFMDGAWRGYDLAFGVECIYPTPTHWMPLPPAPDGGAE